MYLFTVTSFDRKLPLNSVDESNFPSLLHTHTNTAPKFLLKLTLKSLLSGKRWSSVDTRLGLVRLYFFGFDFQLELQRGTSGLGGGGTPGGQTIFREISKS